MFFRKYAFIFFTIIGQMAFAGECCEKNVTQKSALRETVEVVSIVVVTTGVCILAAPVVIPACSAATAATTAATAAAAAKTAAVATVFATKASAAAVAAKGAIIAIAPVVQSIYTGVLCFKAAHWGYAYQQEKKKPYSKQKLKQLLEEEQEAGLFEERLHEAFSYN